MPCLGYTHFQPAQLVTVGKRATLWCYELILDLLEIERRIGELKFLGVKGTTGTQASFLELFEGDDARVEALDRMVADAFGFERTYPVSGQTYSRKVDAQVLAAIAGIAESAHRFGTDLRLLAHEREVEEPFEAQQIGSSAMAYKRNPMRAERMCSLARFVLALPAVAGQTAATQWLERTLDDSAVRRLTVPQAFLAVNAILNLYLNVVPGPGRPSLGDRAPRRRGTAVHGDREPADGGGPGRRRSPRSARADPRPRHGGREPAEGGRRRKRPARPDPERSGVPAARFPGAAGAAPIHRPIGATGRCVPGAGSGAGPPTLPRSPRRGRDPGAH